MKVQHESVIHTTASSLLPPERDLVGLAGLLLAVLLALHLGRVLGRDRLHLELNRRFDSRSDWRGFGGGRLGGQGRL